MKSKDDKCNLCNKDRNSYDGCVWYTGDIETLLCKGCYLKFCRNREFILLKKKCV